MTDLERVLQVLDCVSGFGHCSEAFAGGICAYCIPEVAKKAKELLKEQDNEIDTLKTLLLGYETGAIMKEQNAMRWINVKDRLPNENGSYLVVYKAFQYALMGVKRFAKDLHSVDKYNFHNEHRPGWYEYDDEYGYFERDDITHWMPLPNLPEKDR